jgi:hypothetical protein
LTLKVKLAVFLPEDAPALPFTKISSGFDLIAKDIIRSLWRARDVCRGGVIAASSSLCVDMVFGRTSIRFVPDTRLLL